jgi:hypothetical protein
MSFTKGWAAAGTIARRSVLSLAILALAPLAASAQGEPSCTAPAEALNIEQAPDLVHLRIARKQPIKIVAIGSSSTSGAGATSDAATYPSQLEAILKAALPGIPVTVLNKGIGGEEAAQMVARFDADVIDENPDLVLWQVGSNSVLRDHPTPGEVIRQGVERLKASGADVILVNPQYAPKILAKPDVGHALDVITATARDAEVGVFNRFALMRYWHETQNIPFATFISPDGLHMNDWSYACTAQIIAAAILEGTKVPAATATAHAPAPKR